VLDATRCISYTTIESRASIPESLRASQGALVFGCDLCQEVCPWNLRERRSLPPDVQGLRERIRPRPEWLRPAIAWLLELDEARWREATRHTALKRARYQGLLRNALVAAGNSGDAAFAPLLRRHVEGADPLLAEHACWALERLGVAISAP
jgi:epoxyqueuosine reductase